MAKPTPRAKKTGSICIVDDTVIHVTLLRGMLEPRGHTVIPTTTSAEALEAVMEWPPNVLLVDIGLPDMDGFELVRELRRRGLTEDTHVVFMTSGNRPNDRLHASDLEAADFISKPFDIDETIALVEDLIARPTAASSPKVPVVALKQLLPLLQTGWRLALPEELIAGKAVSRFSAEDLLATVTARVSAKAHSRGVEVRVHPVPPIDLEGDRELAATAWAQVVEAGVVRAEPGTAVEVSVGSVADRLIFRVSITCPPATVERMQQLVANPSLASPIRLERRREGGVDLVVEHRQELA